MKAKVFQFKRVEGSPAHNLAVIAVAEQASIPANEPAEVTMKISRLMLKTDFDLRGLHAKVDYIRSTPLCTGWMVFLNKAGDLAHIMHADDTDSYIRMKVPQRLKGCSPVYIQRYFFNRMVSRYVI